VDQTAGAATSAGSPQAFPRALRIDRPHDDYRLDLQVSKIDLNVNLSADRFELAQPENSELVRVNTTADAKQPARDSHP